MAVIAAMVGVRAGIVLVPMGIINQWHEPPIFHGVERPTVDRVIIPTTWREGAVGELDSAGAGYEIITVPGALEIPQALGQAVANGLLAETGAKFAGAIALGCVIRGETSHYDIVCDNANHWMMRVAMDNRVPLGNAILTVDTHAQAMARAEGGRLGKGGDAARACLRLMELARDFKGRR